MDCATVDAKVGVARAVVEKGVLAIESATMCPMGDRVHALVAEWLNDGHRPSLLALDAPLGWPKTLGSRLAEHRAGMMLSGQPNDLFRRETDRFVKERVGKQPLDVGADRIARTAHAALRTLDEVRRATGESIPLAWDRRLSAPVSAIEVYPAGTLASRGWPASRYKRPEQGVERKPIIERLGTAAELPKDTSAMEASADALDAAICTLAAADFLAGRSMAPIDLRLARHEGWIWVREPEGA